MPFFINFSMALLFIDKLPTKRVYFFNMSSSSSRLLRISLASFLAFFSLSSTLEAASPIAQRLSGQILLQVEQRGAAWYIDPVTKTRFSLGGAEQAYALMRTRGLGIRHQELERYLAMGRFPARLAGRIVLDIESHGEAYYISPKTLTATFLRTAEDAYTLMRRVGLGITDAALAQIPISQLTPSPSTERTPLASTTVPPSRPPFFEIEQATWRNINTYRASKGLPLLLWNETVASVARTHSAEMAAGTTGFNHDGFDARYETLKRTLPIGWMGENIESNIYEDDTAAAAVQSWIESPGHRENIEKTVFTHTGIGVAQSSLGEYFLTQLFVSLP